MLKRLAERLQAWRDRPKKIDMHLGKAIKYCFTAGGKHYYRFESDTDIPQRRFIYAQQFHKEMELRMTKGIMEEFCAAMTEHLNKGELQKCFEVVKELQYRLEWTFEPDSLLRFASVIFFDLKENLADYDSGYNKKKIEAFKKKEMLPYFLKMLMGESHPLLSLSTQDLATYLQQLTGAIKKSTDSIRLGKDKKQLTGQDTSPSWMQEETKS